MKLIPVFIFFLLWSCSSSDSSSSKNTQSPQVTSEKMSDHVQQIINFIHGQSKYNQEIAFLIDMKIMSGKHRFFVCDLKENKILEKGLVAHGSGSETGVEGELKFSNIDNSHCTSLGKYYVGNSYYGQYGKAYKLHGLDPTNSNAFDRNIVLHKYKIMPYLEQNTPIVNSLGCPMVHEKFYKVLEKYIDNSNTKIILDIYY